MAQLTIANDEVELAHLAAERVTQLIERAVATHTRALVALTGGQTPRRLYSNLADDRQPWRARVPWRHVHLFWGDERHVPPEHPDSNYGMAKATLLDYVPIPADRIHRIRGEMRNAQDAAADYERTLDGVSGFSQTFDVVSGFSRTFDVMLLGVGEDAHIASIFPGGELLESGTRPSTGREDAGGRPFTGRRVAAVWAAHLNAWRITLTPQAILDSRALIVLVAGAHKAAAVGAALDAPQDVTACPAQLLRAAGDRVEWFVDRVAASRLV
jgi:6-phosphogluconolactonase